MKHRLLRCHLKPDLLQLHRRGYPARRIRGQDRWSKALQVGSHLIQSKRQIKESEQQAIHYPHRMTEALLILRDQEHQEQLLVRSHRILGHLPLPATRTIRTLGTKERPKGGM
jgi:hypothetical protein